MPEAQTAPTPSSLAGFTDSRRRWPEQSGLAGWVKGRYRPVGRVLHRMRIQRRQDIPAAPGTRAAAAEQVRAQVLLEVTLPDDKIQ